MILAVAIAAVAGFAAAHLLRLHRVPPATAIVIWIAALSLRALAVVLAAAWLLVHVPGTRLFSAVTHWCWHQLASVTLAGHDIGHLTAVAPALLGVASLISLAFASLRLGRPLRRLTRNSRGRGPAGSVIVGGAAIELAVVGILRPRVLVSAGALLELDDDELAAALAHERAHIARRHRVWLLYAQICAAIARLVPGTRAAMAELSFHLERDADQWALSRPIEPHALAAALRKASGAPADRRLTLALGGTGLDERLDEILAPGQTSTCARLLLWRGVAIALVMLVAGVAAVVPSALAAGFEHRHGTREALHCHERDARDAQRPPEGRRPLQ